MEPAYRDVKKLRAQAVGSQQKTMAERRRREEEAKRRDREAKEQARLKLLAGWYRDTEIAISRKQWRKAIDFCDKILALEPAYRDVKRLRAQAAGSQQKEMTERRQREKEAAQLKREVEEERKRREEKAKRRTKEKEQQELIAGWYRDAKIAISKKQWRRAIDFYDKILALEPAYRDVKRLRAQAAVSHQHWVVGALIGGVIGAPASAIVGVIWDNSLFLGTILDVGEFYLGLTLAILFMLTIWAVAGAICVLIMKLISQIPTVSVFPGIGWSSALVIVIIFVFVGPIVSGIDLPFGPNSFAFHSTLGGLAAGIVSGLIVQHGSIEN